MTSVGVVIAPSAPYVRSGPLAGERLAPKFASHISRNWSGWRANVPGP
jgi:hypothetical protein